jgi:hypothetical protein
VRWNQPYSQNTDTFRRGMAAAFRPCSRGLEAAARTRIIELSLIVYLGSVGESGHLLMLSGCGFRSVAGGTVELGYGAW